MFSKKGYSPLETLVALILIAIFIGVFYSKYQKIETETKINMRNDEIRILNISIDLYRMKKGSYPDNLSVLFSEGYIDNKTQELLNLSARIKNGELLDPFGNRYIYDKKIGKVKK